MLIIVNIIMTYTACHFPGYTAGSYTPNHRKSLLTYHMNLSHEFTHIIVGFILVYPIIIFIFDT